MKASKWAPELEKRYQEQIKESEKFIVRRPPIFFVYLGYPATVILDLLTNRSDWYFYLLSRWLVMVPCMILFTGYFRGWFKIEASTVLWFFSALGSIGIALNNSLHGGYTSLQSIEIVLFMATGATVLPYGSWKVLGHLALMLTLYLGISLGLDGFEIKDQEALVRFGFVCLIVCLVAFLDSNLRESLKRQSFLQLIETERAKSELNNAHEKLKEFDRLKSQFFANVSHELRTPLTLILGIADSVLQKGRELQEPLQGKVTVIERNARVLLEHVNDLLDVAKLESGKMQIERLIVDVGKIVSVTASLFEIQAKERSIIFSVDVPRGLQAAVDPQKLQRILLNLLSNAFKFSPDHSRIGISLSKRREDSFEIKVSDTGPGIDQKARQWVFERFKQIDSGDARRFEGTGLGLSIVKEFVELHEGTVRIEDTPGGGASFIVQIPIGELQGKPVEADLSLRDLFDCRSNGLQRTLSQGIEHHLAADSHRPRVLVVEDHADMREFIAEILGREFQVLLATNGQEGLRKAREFKPDVIVTDLMMPGMSGEQMLKIIRKDYQELSDVSILLLTAKVDDELRIRLLSEGAQDCLVKPFLPGELRTRVSNLAIERKVKQDLREQVQEKTQSIEALTQKLLSKARELETVESFIKTSGGEIRKINQTRGLFLDLVSHELRTPLTALTTSIHLLGRHLAVSSDQTLEKLLRMMISASDRMVELVSSIFEYVKVESGDSEVNLTITNLSELVTSTGSQMKQKASLKGLELRVEIGEGLPEVNTDPRLLKMVLVQLIGNAIKFTEKGSVEVRVDRRGEGSVAVTIEDTGPGISRELESRLFEPFQQMISVYQKQYQGLGLGLPLVKALVKALGGQISLVSKQGKGSAFTLVFPLNAAIDQKSQLTVNC
ncbi:MAG: ATP-binding protein [Bdellovibrionota bacterium]